MSNNKSKSTGLRFIWIPGRKKHQPKGRYDTTNKQNLHGHHQQKKNEPWSLGGSKGQEELLKSSDVATEAGNHCASAAVAALPAASALGATSVNPCDSNEHLNGNASKDPTDTDGGCSDEGAHSMATMPARHKCNGAIKKLSLNSSGDGLGMLYENASTASATPSHFAPLCSPHVLDLPDIPWNRLDRGSDSVSMYPSRFQKDLDSIEKCDATDDDVDATRMVYLDPKNMTCGYGTEKRQQTSKQRRDASDDEDEKEDKGVRCLYYALQCCECTIS